MKFTGVKGKSNAAVVRINIGAQKVTFEDCVFDGNETVNADGTSVGTGACLALYNGAELTVKGCTFTGNAGCGAAVVVNHEDATVSRFGLISMPEKLWREDQLRMWIRILLTSFSVRLPVLLSTMRNRVTAK